MYRFRLFIKLQILISEPSVDVLISYNRKGIIARLGVSNHWSSFFSQKSLNLQRHYI